MVTNTLTHDTMAAEQLFPVVYAELRALAQSFCRKHGQENTLQATALVHEAYLRLIDQTAIKWDDRAHFYNIAAQAMRQLLTDHCRRRKANKRGGSWQRITLDCVAESSGPEGLDLAELDAALTRLTQLDPRQARVAELRLLTGLTVPQTAEALGVSARTVDVDWRFARAWLQRALQEHASC